MTAPVPCDACTIADGVRAGRLRAAEVVEAHLDALTRTEPETHAFLHLDAEGARRAARDVDALVRAGRGPGPLAGVPVALKDLFATRDMPTTAGSKILAGFRPPYDASVVERLRAAGAVLVGKTTLDEFGMGALGIHGPGPPPRNPWSPDHLPGGSSSGSAAAVARGMVPAALGTDTGGSVRWPAACCNLVGLRPTYGRIPRHGMIAFASSLDQAGILTRTVRDAARLLAVLAGPCPRDPTSRADPVEDYEAACGTPVRGRVLGIVRNAPSAAGVADDVAARIEEAARALATAGVRVVEVTVRHLELAVAAYQAVSCVEAASNLARYDGLHYGRRVAGRNLADTVRRTRSEGFGREVRRRILLGTYLLSRPDRRARYEAARAWRRAITGALLDLLDACDALLLPTGPDAAPARETHLPPWAAWRLDALAAPASLAGLPAANLPAGFVSRNGRRLPVGAQLVGRPLDEAGLLSLAAALERTLGHGATRPDPRTP